MSPPITRNIFACSRPAIRELGHFFPLPASVSTTHSVPLVAQRSFSTSDDRGFFQQIKDKVDPRTEENQNENQRKQMQAMANAEKWTLHGFKEQIESALGWKQYIPGMSQFSQMKEVKEAKKSLDSIEEVVGKGATSERLSSLTRKEKLEIGVDDLDALVKQFRSMEVMHRMLRHRKVDGKPIPSNQEEINSILQSEGPDLLTKKEKKMYAKMQQDSMMRGLKL